VTPLRLVDAIKSAQPLSGAASPTHLRTFLTARPVGEHRFTFRPTAEALDPAATTETLSSGVFGQIPPARLNAYALVLNVAGEFQTIDEIFVEDSAVGAPETLVQLALTRVESADGEPSLVNVFLILPMTPEIALSDRVRLRFSVSQRSFEGEVTALENEIPDCVVELKSSEGR
jgi:hypothetical protein